MIAPFMNLIALPAFTDHYIWMLDDGARAIVLDSGASAPVAEAQDARRLKLAAILVTRHRVARVDVTDDCGLTTGHIGCFDRTGLVAPRVHRNARLMNKYR
jgi:hypothetical protein